MGVIILCVGKGLGLEPNIQWQIVHRSPTYQPVQKVCQLHLTKKLQILAQARNNNCLHQQSQICVICWHKA